MLICPVCSAPLTKTQKTLQCEGGHSFDRAASGYCNLLTGSKAGRFIGDNKDMVAARRLFLESDTYRPLQEGVCQCVRELTAPLSTVHAIDCGCGEGYYTRAVTAALEESGKPFTVIGADISKAAVQYAAKRDKKTDYITASSFHLPIADHSADLILSLFAPAPAGEFRRILASGGHVLQVVPGAEHLWELKQAVYDQPYANQEEKHLLEGFLLQEKRRLTARAQLNSPELIQALFAMTPYSHHTPAQGLERLRRLKELDVTISFLLMIYRAAN